MIYRNTYSILYIIQTQQYMGKYSKCNCFKILKYIALQHCRIFCENQHRFFLGVKYMISTYLQRVSVSYTSRGSTASSLPTRSLFVNATLSWFAVTLIITELHRSVLKLHRDTPHCPKAASRNAMPECRECDECPPDRRECCECTPDRRECCECTPDRRECCECTPDRRECCECPPDRWECRECPPDREVKWLCFTPQHETPHTFTQINKWLKKPDE